MLVRTDTIKNQNTGTTHRVRTSATCKSTNVVYVTQCDRCGQQYVGETEQALHGRINSHRSDVRLRKMEKLIAANFNSPNHMLQDMKLMVVEQIKRSDSWMRRTRESHWITTLDTPSPWRTEP